MSAGASRKKCVSCASYRPDRTACGGIRNEVTTTRPCRNGARTPHAVGGGNVGSNTRTALGAPYFASTARIASAKVVCLVEMLTPNVVGPCQTGARGHAVVAVGLTDGRAVGRASWVGCVAVHAVARRARTTTSKPSRGDDRLMGDVSWSGSRA